MAVVVRGRFYGIVALVLAVLVFAGFARTFYLRAWFDVPPITLLLQLHGFLFSAWFALYVVQTRLIAANHVRAHRQLGIAGVALAALVVIVGLVSTVVSAGAPRARPMGLSSPQFVLIPLVAIVTFGGLVAAALVYRYHPAVHKRLMTLAMITVLGPPVARLIAAAGQRESFLAIQTTVAAAFVIWCLMADWLRYRVVHPIYSVGGPLLVLSWPLRAAIAQTAGWEGIGAWMAGL
ncbi:MAG TPA: hypothetical protein VFL16_10485 [Steroidobacteraceae bacterium]|nr:hypothetical protein [Steroidobacteraceae bacterium]